MAAPRIEVELIRSPLGIGAAYASLHCELVDSDLGRLQIGVYQVVGLDTDKPSVRLIVPGVCFADDKQEVFYDMIVKACVEACALAVANGLA